MENEKHIKIKAKLEERPKQVTNLEVWLYVVINTAKSIIDNTSKNDLDIVMKFADCNSTSQI